MKKGTFGLIASSAVLAMAATGCNAPTLVEMQNTIEKELGVDVVVLSTDRDHCLKDQMASWLKSYNKMDQLTQDYLKGKVADRYKKIVLEQTKLVRELRGTYKQLIFERTLTPAADGTPRYRDSLPRAISDEREFTAGPPRTQVTKTDVLTIRTEADRNVSVTETYRTKDVQAAYALQMKGAKVLKSLVASKTVTKDLVVQHDSYSCGAKVSLLSLAH